MNEEKEEVGRKSSSAKYGRRSLGNVAEISGKFDQKFEKAKGGAEEDSSQVKLEKYWRSLHEFQQFHKGRLDSANKDENHLYSLGKNQ